MFTESQLREIKNSSFPQVQLKKVVLSDSPNRNLFSIQFYISEDYIGEKKIYRNVNKDAIKIKTFLYYNSLENEDIRNISDLEQYIENNKLVYSDLFACTDYKGGYNAQPEELKKDDSIILTYSTNLSIDKKTILDNLKIGFMIYHDHKQYAKEMNVSISSVNIDLLCGNINENFLIQGSQNISDGTLNDLRTTKKVLAASERLNDFIQALNLEKKATNVLSNNNIFKDVKKYFSKSLLSTNENGYINFVFNVDTRKISSDNFNLIPKTNDKRFDTILSQVNTEISSIDILRREYKKNFSKKINKIDTLYPTGNSPITLVSTKDNNLINSIIQVVNVDKKTNKTIGSIKELKLFDSHRTFNVCDATAYISNNVILSYGVKISITDTYYSFIKTINEKLLENLSKLKSYLVECLNPVNYDASVDAFTDSFINNVFTIKYQQSVEESIKDIVSAMKLMGFLDENLKLSYDVLPAGNYDVDFAKELISFVIPNTASQQLLTYFVSFYEKFINLINKKILSARDGKIELEYWFKSNDEMVDTTKRPGYGYGYFNRYSDVDSISKIDSSCLRSKISTDVKAYSNTNVDVSEISVSPSFINSEYKKIVLDVFNPETKTYDSSLKSTIKDMQFLDLEMEIKSYNNINISTDFTPAPPNPIKNIPGRFIIPTPKQNLIENLSFFDKDVTLSRQGINLLPSQIFGKNAADKSTSSDILEKNTIDNVRNRSELLLSDTLVFENGGQQKNRYSDDLKYDIKNTKNNINENVEPEEIFVALMKMDIKPRKFANLEKIPFQISALNSKKDNFFSVPAPDKKDKYYLKDVSYNSKFLFLFNTICKVEYAEINSTVNAFSWKVLTQEILKNSLNKLLLCRLSLYENSLSDIDGFRQIEMPFYDKYFILDNNSPAPKQLFRMYKNTKFDKLSKRLPIISLQNTDLMKTLNERYSDSTSSRKNFGPAPGSLQNLANISEIKKQQNSNNIRKSPFSTKIKTRIDKVKKVLNNSGEIISDLDDV